ncbi:cephalotocin receptor 2-like [Liolophura sinensis]|uniref:cephalotocin receptor 2-like n=1 Tax=Liolophura sinensis TaxID=3198878 RepID=UPI0031594140
MDVTYSPSDVVWQKDVHWWNGSTWLNNTLKNVTKHKTRDEELAKIEIAVLAIILVLAIFGNTCVLLALSRKRTNVSRMHIFIMHLSIADLLVAIFNVLPQMLNDITFRFQGNDSLCRFVKYMQVVVIYLSTYVLVMTAVDRYRAICFPLSNHSWTARRVHLMVVGAYFIAFTLSTPQLFLFHYGRTVTGEMDCLANFDPFWLVNVYVTWFTAAVYIVPLLILTFAYGSICYTVWLRSRQQKSASHPAKVIHEVQYKSTASTLNSAAEISNRVHRKDVHPRSHSCRGFSRAKIKTIKLTFVVILAYVICWSPFFISQLWWLYDESVAEKQYAVIMMLLASLNSCCNPWIYLAFSGNLLYHIIPCKSLKPQRKSTQFTTQPTGQSKSRKDGDSIEMPILEGRGSLTGQSSRFTRLTSLKWEVNSIESSSPKKSPSPRSSSLKSLVSPHVNRKFQVRELNADREATSGMMISENTAVLPMRNGQKQCLLGETDSLESVHSAAV